MWAIYRPARTMGEKVHVLPEKSTTTDNFNFLTWPIYYSIWSQEL